MKNTLTLIFAAILSAAMLAGCSKPIDDPVYTSAPDGEKIIDEATAKRAAKQHADFGDAQVQFTKVLLDTDDGDYEYDVEFIHDGYEYEFEIDAKDGRVVSFDKERLDRDDIFPIPSENPDNSENSNKEKAVIAPKTQYITKEEALVLALEKANLADVSQEALIDLKIEFEIDDGIPEYEIDFKYDGYEYDITVNAENRAILKYEKEKDDYREKEVQNPEKPQKQEDATLISKDKAKEIAFQHAGIGDSTVYDYECELDREGTITKYEVDFNSGNYEYSYDIDAVSGNIIHWEKEIDD